MSTPPSTLTQLILDTAMNAFISMDASGSIVEWNRSAEMIFGYERSEVLGRPVADVIIPERFRDAHRRGLEHYLRTGEGPVLGSRVILDGLRRDGSEFPVELTIRALEDAGDTSFHAFIRDITDLKESERELKRANEELREVQEVKDRFLAMAAHELRSPMAAISGYTSVMLQQWERFEDSQKREIVTSIDGLSARLGRVVSDLLSLTRIERGVLEADLQEVPVEQLVRDVIRGLDIEDVEVDVPVGLSARVDADYLAQVLINLINNAFKYGKPPVHVRARADSAGVVIEVVDHGDGIDADRAGLLFEPFERGPHTGGIEGTGLGLAIVRAVVEAHGGSVWHAPNEPVGSVFAVHVPRIEELPQPLR